MTTRREFMRVSVAVAAATPLVPARAASDAYRDAVDRLWQRNRTSPTQSTDLRREWIRLATLAASSHNSQPWKFRLRGDSIIIMPHYQRRCAAVDPDDSHLFKSLGCAAENLVQAATGDGFHASARFDPVEDAVVVEIERAPSAAIGNLAAAIIERRCSRVAYDGKPLDAKAHALLASSATGEGVAPIFLQSPAQKEAVLEYVRQGNLAQFADPVFVKELRDWVRFNPADAIASGDGLAGAVSGQPSIPGWFGRWMFNLVLSGKKQADIDATNIRSSSGIVAFVGDRDDKASWVAAGCAYERFALQAAALGVRNAFINQPIEVRSLRPQLHAWLGVPQQHVHLIARYGCGPATLHSLRRPLEAVLVEG